MTWLSWLLSLYFALSQAEQGVIVRGPLQIEAVPVFAQVSRGQLQGAQAVWVWSPFREPRRWTVEQLKRGDRPRAGSGRTILVRVPAARDRDAAGVRLIAAPVEMWREVPESLLPSWPVPRSGRLVIPADASRPWRLRVAGEGEGSFWTDLPVGARGAVLSVVPAAGARSALVAVGGRRVTGASVRVFESGLGRLGRGKDWALLIGDGAGRFAVPGLPDRSELTWLASASGHPPKKVVSTASRLPARIVLAEGATVTGRIRDITGHPLAGASVQVDAWASSDAPITFAVQVDTDAQGRFAASAVPPGKAMLSIRKTGWAPLRQPIEVPSEGLDAGPLSLSRGDSLAVRVVDDADEPVAGAEVRPDLGEAVTTRADGTAILSHLPARTEIRILAAAKSHLPADQTVELPAAGPLELRLPRAFSVKGRFVASDGSPSANAAVKVTRGRNFDTQSLDDEGRFALTLRPAQAYTLTFSSPQSASLEVPMAEGAAGEERDLGDLRAPASGEVIGRLVDGASGEPVGGARIWCPRPSAQGPLVAWMSRDLLETSSGPEGTFRLRGMPPGTAMLRIEASGFARTQRAVEVPGEGAADLGDVPLPKGATVAVTAGPKGDGALASIEPGSEGLPFDRLTAPVLDGVAHVEQVPVGAAKVSVLRGSAILCEKTIEVPAEVGEMPVECSAEGILVRGAVTVGGRPAGAGVLVWETAAGSLPEGVLHFKTAAGLTQSQVFTANSPVVETPLEDGGTFATHELRTGTWQVSFQPEGGGTTESLPIMLSEEKEQTVALPFPGFSVLGTVLDSDGKPVAEARVRETEGGTTTLSAKDGSFRFDGLRAKTYYFSAAKDEATSDSLKVAVGEGRPGEPIVLTLRDDGGKPALQVQVTDERGAPVPGTFVFVDLPGSGLRVVTSDAAGTAKLMLEPPYPETVRVAARIGDVWALGAWQPFERARAGLELTPGPVGSIAILAGKSEGLLQVAAPGGWNLTVLLSMLGAPPMLKPGAPLEIGGLPAGTYEIGLIAQTRSVGVKAGETVEVAPP